MNMLEYAKTELDIIGMTDSGDEMNIEMRNNILEIIEKFSDQGHSRFSASYAIDILNKLLNFKPLSPLTGENSEWVEIRDSVFQNKRYSSVFRQLDCFNGQAYDIHGKVFIEHYYDENNVERTSSFTSSDSIVPITFPYVPNTEYIDVGFRNK